MVTVSEFVIQACVVVLEATGVTSAELIMEISVATIISSLSTKK